MTSRSFLPGCLTALAGVVCVCPAWSAEDVVVLNGPNDMLSLWRNMCDNLQERAQVRISPAWGVTPKQAIDVTMQDLYADSYGCDFDPSTGIVTIRPRYSSTAKLIAAHRNPALVEKLDAREKLALQNAQSRLESLIQPEMDDFSKVLALHDNIVDFAEFVPVQGDACTEMFLTGKGVCEGYARALHVLLTMAGIQTRFAFGDAKGENHLWNLVRVDGLWYHVDPTWDDGMNGYGYFLLTDKELAVDHRWDRYRFHATAKEGHLYYRRKGLCPESYEEMWKGALKAWNEGAEFYQCYFPAFESREKFLQELPAFRRANPEILLDSWRAPKDKDNILHLQFLRTSTLE